MTSNSKKYTRRDWVFVAALPSPATVQTFMGNPTTEEKSIAAQLFSLNGSGKFRTYGATSSKVIIKHKMQAQKYQYTSTLSRSFCSDICSRKYAAFPLSGLLMRPKCSPPRGVRTRVESVSNADCGRLLLSLEFVALPFI